jgi:hypothetical protein
VAGLSWRIADRLILTGLASLSSGVPLRAMPTKAAAGATEQRVRQFASLSGFHDHRHDFAPALQSVGWFPPGCDRLARTPRET